MRQRLKHCLAIVLLVVCVPADAEALDLGFFRWWDSLSGPGPFSGFVIDAAFVCYGTRRQADPSAERADVFVDLDCFNARRDRRRISVGVEWAWLAASNNNLPYGEPRTQSPPDVQAYPFLVTIDVGLHAAVEVGAGIGFVRFSGEGFGFSRFALQPRLALKPLVLLGGPESRQRKLEFLELRLFGTGIPGNIVASDFGAVGSFRSEGEWLPGFSASVNLVPLIRR